MLFEVYRIFNGEVIACKGHSARTLDGFYRTIRKYPTGNGHEFSVVIPAAYAKRLGLTEFNGVLYSDSAEIVCRGAIQKA